MAKHGAVWLIHIGAHLFASRIVGLGRADGDQALIVTCHRGDDGTVRGHLIHQKVEDKTAGGVSVTIGMRQAKPQDRIKQMPLRLADAVPLFNPLLCRHIRHQAIVAAGRAKGIGAFRRHRPVADIIHLIGAKPHLLFRLGDDLPVRFTRRRQRFHGKPFRHESQAMAAGDAEAIVEMDRLAAGCAGKKLHV
ncbi:hypothetical protein D3C87_1413430 [compost metagenome]